ncbi:MAG: response regulator [Myxococcales bacterium]|nr:response regulator [Myxococcales bacterium]MCB9575484.1 response regulator [Polyangiaceae bacterium]
MHPDAAVRVLLVEDQRDLRELLKSGLERRGIQVLACGEAGEARTGLKSSPDIDAVVTDATLREVDDGLDLAREIHETQPDMPVVVVSGSRDVIARAKGVASAVLEKPITAGKLASVLESVTGGIH